MNKTNILDYLKEHYAEFKEKYHIEQIGLFGSYARDEATKDSDIDICIKTEHTDLFDLVHLKEDLKNLFHTNVDIIRVRKKMNPYLKKRIDKEAIYV
jgi:predicted nucleotidyltransferase